MNELDPEIRDLARGLGDLRLLWLDMSQARALFERLAEMPDGFGDFRLASALWAAGLIAYRRSFTGGKGISVEPGRTQIPQGLIDALEPQQRELHGEALLMAERLVAHRVTDQGEVEVWLEIEHGPPPRVRSVRTRHNMSFLRTHNAFEFAALAKHVADQLEEECRSVEREIMTAANASGVAGWSGFTSESPEWVNILSGDARPQRQRHDNEDPTKKTQGGPADG